MTTIERKKVTFAREEDKSFNAVLRKRVDLFFKEREISPKANRLMIFKSLFLVSIVALVYAGLLLGANLFLSYALLGFCVAVCTMNIAHDALHGAYLSKPKLNRALGFLMDVFGGSSFYWKKEHTVDHHTFPNVHDHDADLDVPFILRLCPKAERMAIHRYQHLYAPFLYCLNLLHWIYFSDIKRMVHILLKKHDKTLRPSNQEIWLLFTFKAIHMLLFIAIPLMVLNVAWWQVVLGYIGLICTGGIILTVVFQMAHIVENVAFPLPNHEGKIEYDFIAHQLATTSNFGTKSKLTTFLFGGLNFQVEHHLFPHICHIHLSKIAPIVRSTTKEFGLPYNENPSFFSALSSHFKLLKKLGRSE